MKSSGFRCLSLLCRLLVNLWIPKGRARASVPLGTLDQDTFGLLGNGARI